MSGWSRTTKQTSNRTNTKCFLSELDAYCLQAIDFCLLAIIFLVPFFFGGRHPLGKAVFICFTCLASVIWTIHIAIARKFYSPGIWSTILAFVVLGIAFMQIIPLPSEYISLLSPRIAELFPQWNEGIRSHTWHTLSLYPEATKASIAVLTSYVFLFFILVGRINDTKDIKYWLRAIAISSIVTASFGIIQYFTSNGLFLWTYEVPYANAADAAKGSFTCKNHFAHFLAIGAAPLLVWIVDSLQIDRQQTDIRNSLTKPNLFSAFLLITSLALLILAVLMSFSRGGFLVLAIVLLVTVLACAQMKLISSYYTIALILLGLLVAGGLSTTEYDRWTRRIDALASASIDELDHEESRRKIWKANLEAIAKGSIFGSGAGTHREIYPVYMSQPLDVEYTHAENGYLQIATENGWSGSTLLILVIATGVIWCWKSVRNSTSQNELLLAISISTGILASVLHSVFDFVWFIPSCMSIALVLLACGVRLSQITNNSNSIAFINSKPFICSICIVVSIVATSCSIASLRLARASFHWDQYLLTAEEFKKEQHLLPASIPSTKEKRLHQLDTLIYHLKQVVKSNPNFARAHLRLAANYLDRFNICQELSGNSMTVEQIRDAAVASKFESAQALNEWLKIAFGKNHRLLYLAHSHTRHALNLSPLEGKGYLYLASLVFLEGSGEKIMNEYISQALRLRPYDGKVNFEAGKQLLLAGHYDQAIDYWKRIYRYKGKHQKKIIKALANHVPVSLFLEYFEPNWDTLNIVWESYKNTCPHEDQLHFLRFATNAAKNESQKMKPVKAAKIWLLLSHMHGDIQQNAFALQCATQAFYLDQSSYSIRRRMGHLNLVSSNFEEAETHLRWCLARKNGDQYVKRDLMRVSEGRSRMAALNPSTNY